MTTIYDRSLLEHGVIMPYVIGLYRHVIREVVWLLINMVTSRSVLITYLLIFGMSLKKV